MFVQTVWAKKHLVFEAGCSCSWLHRFIFYKTLQILRKKTHVFSRMSFTRKKADPLFPALSHPSDAQPILGQMIVGRVHAPSFHLQAQFNRGKKRQHVSETHTLFQDKLLCIYTYAHMICYRIIGASYMKYLYYFNINRIWLPPHPTAGDERGLLTIAGQGVPRNADW